MDKTTRRGRPPAGHRAEREQAILDATLAELIEHGWEGVTMLAIARRVGSSKETLYSWFGNREGLLRALIQHNADVSAQRITAALDSAVESQADPVDTLVGYARGLLTLLTGEGSVVLNRAAMSNPDLAAVLLESGRHRIGPLVERYLADLSRSGRLALTMEPEEAFRVLYGLVMQDTQIRVLLGEPPPSASVVAERAEVAVARFLTLAAQGG